jgi:hypothetical protein
LEVAGQAQWFFAGESTVSSVPFHGFSPVIKSLHVNFTTLTSSQIFDLTLSFPLLEDLTVVTYGEATDSGNGSNELPTVALPSSPPIFTGSLELWAQGGMKPIANRLLSLPGGIHFRKLTDVAPRGRSFADNGIGGGVFSYPRIPRYHL